ncbi:MAG TPA: methylenetetrahydrofolate reductase [Candidatus Dormibacteraeota bacterium]
MARIPDLLERGRTFSFEFFPPKTDEESDLLAQTLRELEPLGPSFVSVTYRGGRSSRWPTHDLVVFIRESTSITPMAHLVCAGHERAELQEILADLKAGGIENVLALGGDPLEDGSRAELSYANELVEMARATNGFAIGVAAQTQGHPLSRDLESDRRRLAHKLELADFAITQFFFHAEEYERLREELASLGIHKPVIPGIMPITNLSSIKRMSQLSGYDVPPDVVARIEAAGDDKKEIRRAGIDLACELCSDLLDLGAPGLHFFTLNRSTATREIYSGLGLVTDSR